MGRVIITLSYMLSGIKADRRQRILNALRKAIRKKQLWGEDYGEELGLDEAQWTKIREIVENTK